jgi:hypothetical protein
MGQISLSGRPAIKHPACLANFLKPVFGKTLYAALTLVDHSPLSRCKSLPHSGVTVYLQRLRYKMNGLVVRLHHWHRIFCDAARQPIAGCRMVQSQCWSQRTTSNSMISSGVSYLTLGLQSCGERVPNGKYTPRAKGLKLPPGRSDPNESGRHGSGKRRKPAIFRFMRHTDWRLRRPGIQTATWCSWRSASY